MFAMSKRQTQRASSKELPDSAEVGSYRRENSFCTDTESGSLNHNEDEPSADTTTTTTTTTRMSIMKFKSQASSVDTAYEESRKKQNSAVEEKTVSWAQIDVHSHAVELGDNPSVTHGPPITIGWKPIDSVQVSVDDYESTKPERRDKMQMLLPRTLREDWLKQQGYSRSEMQDAVTQVQKAQKSRAKNAAENPVTKAFRKCRSLATIKDAFRRKRHADDDDGDDSTSHSSR